MAIISWLDRYIEESILVFLSTLTVVVVFFQVVMRYVLGNSLVWSEELARYCFIWLIYIGVSYGVKKKRHISVEVLSIYLNEKGKFILSVISGFLFFVFALVVTYYSFQIFISVQRLSPALNLSMKWVYAAPMVGLALSCIRIVQVIIVDYRKFKDGKLGDLL